MSIWEPTTWLWLKKSNVWGNAKSSAWGALTQSKTNKTTTKKTTTKASKALRDTRTSSKFKSVAWSTLN